MLATCVQHKQREHDCSLNLDATVVPLAGYELVVACIKARHKRAFLAKASVDQPAHVIDPIVARLLSCVDELGLRECAHHDRGKEDPGRIADDRTLLDGPVEDIDVRHTFGRATFRARNGALIERGDTVDIVRYSSVWPDFAPAGLA
eukprot:scaffold123027_cov63-Phaeocystis_antarctica.AAC.2